MYDTYLPVCMKHALILYTTHYYVLLYLQYADC
jgi:hypothetical protein